MSYRPPLCPVNGCGGRLGTGMMMCQFHWRRVPSALRDAVWAAWARFREQPDAPLPPLRQAQRNALASVDHAILREHGITLPPP